MDRREEGRAIKILTLIGEYTREALVIHPTRPIRAGEVTDVCADVMAERTMPDYIDPDNGAEMVAKSLRT